MFSTDFAAAVTTATNTSTAAHKAAVVAFCDEAVEHLGFGVGTVTGGVVNAGAVITSYVVNFVANGLNGKLTFSAAAATFPSGAKNYYGATQTDGPDGGSVVGDSATDPWGANEYTPSASLWTAVITLDGTDGDTTADADEVISTLTKLV
jgi:hypothetical protein